MSETSFKFDENYDAVCNWCQQNPFTNKTLENGGKNLSSKERNKILNKNEKTWGNNIIGNDETKQIKQWTTKLGENFVAKILSNSGYTVNRPIKKACYKPDWEIEKAIIEVKTRNWTTPGTAGEKVLGSPYKYAAIPRLYGKPLKIICVAYQEYELTYGNTKVFGEDKDIHIEQKKMLDEWKRWGIEFVKFSDIINGNYKF